ncbi:DUF58 domain-containing protein [Variovorax sp. PCZ-1]|uniref:DUF58 domain-containing protein n=1 Tax=Variovorax sp. PCZ-1 TaxID=2835533 RepID=UPI0020C09857|nr:DUF58 domain-containing protein [Variovorax sp. PCZ-1]
MIGTIRQRFRQWWQSRIPLTDTWTLTQRNVYILPTRAGWMLAITLLVLLVASINYQLNLGYLLTFMLAGAAVIGMHVTHGNLRGVTMNLIAGRADSTPGNGSIGQIFAGSTANIEVRLSHTRKSQRPSLGLALLDDAHSPHWAWADIPAQGSSTVNVAFKAERRGLHRVPVLQAETRYPLGTFRVWTVWRPKSEVLVYPAPEPHAPALPSGEPRSGGAGAARVQQSGEFDGVRAYRRGDPLKLVVWKKAAKSDELVSRDTQQSQRYELWLDYAACATTEHEAKLSRLTAWVIAADKLGSDYGLRIPGREIKPASGEAHKRACLEALALC